MFGNMANMARSSLSALLFAAIALNAGAGAAEAACNSNAQSLINNLKGAWRGSGTVKPIGGSEERISCRVSYVSSTGQINQSIDCAGTDWKFKAGANVSCDGDKVSGSWNEQVANNSGSVKGSISGDRLNIEVDGPNFQGRFNVKVAGSRHSLTITQFDPGAGRHVPVATISLSR
jgi:hypothetical protein